MGLGAIWGRLSAVDLESIWGHHRCLRRRQRCSRRLSGRHCRYCRRRDHMRASRSTLEAGCTKFGMSWANFGASSTGDQTWSGFGPIWGHIDQVPSWLVLTPSSLPPFGTLLSLFDKLVLFDQVASSSRLRHLRRRRRLRLRCHHCRRQGQRARSLHIQGGGMSEHILVGLEQLCETSRNWLVSVYLVCSRRRVELRPSFGRSEVDVRWIRQAASVCPGPRKLSSDSLWVDSVGVELGSSWGRFTACLETICG